MADSEIETLKAEVQLLKNLNTALKDKNTALKDKNSRQEGAHAREIAELKKAKQAVIIIQECEIQKLNQRIAAIKASLEEVRTQRNALQDQISNLPSLEPKLAQHCRDLEVFKQWMASMLPADPSAVAGQSTAATQSNRTGQCSICMNAEAVMMNDVCKHLCMCVNCAQKVQRSSGKCPVCRCQINQMVRVFLST